MTTTTELHTAIYTTQTLLKQAADVIEHNAKSLAEAHTRNGIIEDREVQAAVESDADLVAHLRAASLPWDQRHKPAQDVPEAKFGDMAEQQAQQTPAKCWKCGDSDPAFTDVCQVPACGMREDG